MGLPESVVRLGRPGPRHLGAGDQVASPAPTPVEQTAAAGSPLPPAPQAGPAVFDVLEQSGKFGSGLAQIVGATMTSADGTPLSWIEGGEPVAITVRINILADMDSPIVGFHVKDRLGQPLFGDNTFLTYADRGLALRQGQQVAAKFVFILPNLASGRYSVTTAIASGTLDAHVQHHWLHDALLFDVHSRHRNGVMVAIPMQEMELKILETNPLD
jgi:lipopolysaccharide transport system ATP-binding protein